MTVSYFGLLQLLFKSFGFVFFFSCSKISSNKLSIFRKYLFKIKGKMVFIKSCIFCKLGIFKFKNNFVYGVFFNNLYNFLLFANKYNFNNSFNFLFGLCGKYSINYSLYIFLCLSVIINNVFVLLYYYIYFIYNLFLYFLYLIK